MKSLYISLLALVMVSLISCDGITGMTGIVKDSKTGEKLAGVEIEMVSYYQTILYTTDSTAWFYNTHSYSCGLIKCDDSFTISFQKDGYEYLELDESYLLENSFPDTVMVYLTPTQ